MHIKFYIVACLQNHCCHGNAEVCSLFIVVGLDVAAQDRDRWQALVNAVTNTAGSVKCGEFVD